MTPRGLDRVMVVIDHLTKRAHFVTGKGSDSANDVAQRFQNEIFRLRGLPNVVVSDRDEKFTSTIWKRLCELLGVKRKAFQPQGDGVSERRNQTLETYLSAFSNAGSDDWDLHLCLVVFTHNARHQASIKMSPFEAIYIKNRHPQTFKVSDEVFLSGQHLSAQHLVATKRKNGAHWVGPFAVVKCIGRSYYQLQLPPKLRMHPVFHTNQLKPYIDKTYWRQRQEWFKVRLADGSEGGLVDDVVDYKLSKDRKLYKITFLGQIKQTWEPVANLTSIGGLIDRYHESMRAISEGRERRGINKNSDVEWRRAATNKIRVEHAKY